MPRVPSVLEDAGEVLCQVRRRRRILEENLQALQRRSSGEGLKDQLEALASNRLALAQKWAYLLGGIIGFMLLCTNSLLASLLLAYFFSMRLLLLSLCVLCRDGRELLRIKETVDNCIQMVTRDIQVSPTQKLANFLTGGDQWALEFDRERHRNMYEGYVD